MRIWPAWAKLHRPRDEFRCLADVLPAVRLEEILPGQKGMVLAQFPRIRLHLGRKTTGFWSSGWLS